MSDYPFFIPQVVLFANSSLFWFKVANEHREFRNYLIFLYTQISANASRLRIPKVPAACSLHSARELPSIQFNCSHNPDAHYSCADL
jgi:hypothetical protein